MAYNTASLDQALGATQRALAKLRRGVADVSIVVLGDSTGDESTEWVYTLTQWLATQYPAYTVNYRLWASTAATDYDAPTTIQIGSGSQTLTVYNASVSGTDERFVLGVAFTARVVTPAPDLVIINFGHNLSTVAANGTAGAIQARWLSLTESLRQAVPTAALLCVAQNPETTGTDQAVRIGELARVCELRGYGFVNVYHAFLEYPSWQTALMAGTVTPNSTGQGIWLAEMKRAFTWNPHAQPRPAASSSLTDGAAQNIFSRGDFATFTAGTVPPGWTSSNVTFAKDTTNYEALNGYAVRMTPIAPGSAFMQQDVANYALYKNRWVTLAVRLRNNTGAANIHVGRIALDDGVTTLITTQDAWGYGQYVWRVISLQVSGSATRLRAIVYASDSSGTGTEDLSVDCAYLAPGLLPRRAFETPTTELTVPGVLHDLSGSVAGVNGTVGATDTIIGPGGKLALALKTQVKNTVLAGPTTGADATPTMRSLVAADLPVATAGAIGAVKPGTNLTVAGDGTLNAAGGGGSSAWSDITGTPYRRSGIIPLYPPDYPFASTATLSSGVMYLHFFRPDQALALTTSSQISFLTGSTAPSAGLQTVVALYHVTANAGSLAPTITLVAKCTLDTGTVTTGSTAYSFTLAKQASNAAFTGHTLVMGDMYAIGILFIGTPGSLLGLPAATSVIHQLSWLDMLAASYSGSLSDVPDSASSLFTGNVRSQFFAALRQ